MPKPEKILAQELLELEVLDLSQGATLGTVVDFALTRDGRVAMVGVLPVRWYTGGLGIAPNAIASVSQDCICLAPDAQLGAFAPDEAESFSVYFGDHIQGKPVLQEDGALLGELVDFAFNLEDGRVVDLVVQDANDKRVRVAVEAFKTIGRDYVVVQRGTAPASPAAAAAEPPAPEPVPEDAELHFEVDELAAAEAQPEEEPAPELALASGAEPTRAEEKAALFGGGESAELSKVDVKKRDFLRGRKAHRDIAAADGELIVVKGGPLDDAALNRIVEGGLLDSVFLEMTVTKK